MNIQEADILNILSHSPFQNQRALAEVSGFSLGVVNRSIRSLTVEGYLTDDFMLTEKARSEFKKNMPKNAIILAAGFGMRMVPINTSSPKGLLEVHSEPLIERLIRQLQEVGIRDIIVVVGFMKEQFDYLIDKYDVKLVVNPDYAKKNNLHSLRLVADRISNTYIIPSDVWCEKNPFHASELYSWYMVSRQLTLESDTRVNRQYELVKAPSGTAGNTMIGIAYLSDEDAVPFRERLITLSGSSEHAGDFWEAALYSKDRMIIPARLVPAESAVEINTYEQLRELDNASNHLKSDALETIASVFHVSQNAVKDIQVLKKGMTNRSFLFSVNGSMYIMRIPGEGTDQMIDRGQEAAVYHTISGYGLCEDPVYLNPENGYKITKYLHGVRVADANIPEDLNLCMDKLRSFHELRLSVPHCFDLFGKIDFYESLWGNRPSVYKDYISTKENVLSLRDYIEKQPKAWCLTHIDAVPDNFLFHDLPDGTRALQLTDWEYAGMQDPHLDLAMWSVYSFYNKSQVDKLLDIYFQGSCEPAIRTKIYCYIAAAGLLWSNWCEYKSTLGIEFGAYAMQQYRYAKDFYRFAMKEMAT